MTDDYDDGDDSAEGAEAAAAQYEDLEPHEAKALVDEYIDENGLTEGDYGTVIQRAWVGLLTEAELTPYPVNNDDEEVEYRGVKLRRSGAG